MSTTTVTNRSSYRLSILAPQNPHALLSELLPILQQHGVSSERLQTISNHPQSMSLTAQVALEYISETLTEQLQTLSNRHRADLIVLPEHHYHQPYRLAVFDMDSTLIQAEVIDQLALHAGVGDKVAEITEQAMQGEIDFNQSFKLRLGMLQGLNESVLQTIANQLPLMPGVETLIKTLRESGCYTAIVSGGFEYFARHLQNLLGIDAIFANTLEIIDGKVTGKVQGEIVNADVKAHTLKQLAQQQNIALDQTLAVGDGANDIPMLNTAGLGIAFHAKPVVNQQVQCAIKYGHLDGITTLLNLCRFDD